MSPNRNITPPTFLALAVCCILSVSRVQAAIMTFDVDLTGRPFNTSTLLRVFGTLTLDPDTIRDGSASIFGSRLFFQRNNETPIALPALPIFSFRRANQPLPFHNVAFDWTVVGNELFLTPTALTPYDYEIYWQSPIPGVPSSFVRIEFGYQSFFEANRMGMTHAILGGPNPRFESARLQPFVANQLRPFRFGTVSGSSGAVPEPGSMVTWSILAGISVCLGFGCARRKQSLEAMPLQSPIS